ncbi:MAG: NAD(P)-dependent glycerol-3-phosphate dehydrogenase [Clostridia bacterium]|nr:NAD(P)-dependent glycerol-3-phosphate dehydrogenase [Clostridia bacterium]
MDPNKIAILGAGTWGVALGYMLAKAGRAVSVWSALPEEIAELRATRRQKNLPDTLLPESIVFTDVLSDAAADAAFVLFAVPSVFVRATARRTAPYLCDGQVVVDVAKGIESETLLFLSEIIDEELCAAGKHLPIVALSGPTHAEEVARDLPTVIVAASEDAFAAAAVQDFFMNTCLRVYTAADVRGVELCGAVKNIVAIAAGVSAGLGFGDNTAAALMTRGMAEIARLGAAMGCASETFYGLAGIGDVIVTGMSVHSRNRRAGALLAEGKTADEARREVGMVVEGFHAVPAAVALAEKYGVEMPIVFAVRDLMAGTVSPRGAVERLMARPKKSEF